MTKHVFYPHILSQSHWKEKDPELVYQAIDFLMEFWGGDLFEEMPIGKQVDGVDAYCLGWTQGQTHLLKYLTKEKP